MPVPVEQIQRLAGFELNALRAAEILGRDFDNLKIPPTGTPIHDINGTVLFYRIPLNRGSTIEGFVDIAANEALGEPLVSVSMGGKWDEKAILREAGAVARSRSMKYDSLRFVAYSFPKIALQFLQKSREVAMLEWKNWKEIPQQSHGRQLLAPSNFERWSFIDEMPAEIRQARLLGFRKRQEIWQSPEVSKLQPLVISKTIKIPVSLVDTREIHYSPRAEDHHPCYELRGQQTNVWCVAASVEMLLNFYRYRYDQPRLAQEMQLGTCNAPNGLPYGEEHKVVDTIEKLSSNTLDSTDIANPGWATFESEIRENRPLISFIPGHSRTVAGYTHSLIHLADQPPFRGLLVYDPWPPTDCAHPEAGGVITRWENFATQTYRHAFTAVLKQV
ncbi:MAG: hypothetical protein HKL98_02485 [Burkholderiales bacterium]|nr:hypothetical protein [Burkholderiales bacterium]